jgi:hypothetical protein
MASAASTYLRTAWRASRGAFILDAFTAAATAGVTAATAWNLSAAHYVAAAVAAVVAVIFAWQLRGIIRERRRDPVALRARLITAMRKIRRNETWLNRDERLLLVSLSSYAGHILLLTDEMEMLDVRQHGGVQLATGFIMPAASTSVYRVVDGYALTRGEDGTLIPADGPLSRRDMWRQARKTGKFIRKGMLDAAPEEIVTVIRQLEDAELLSSKDRD